MDNNLLVTVLGHQNSGKTRTWTKLFNSTVRTGSLLRRLYLSGNEYVEVFLVSGSAEERKKYVGELIKVENPRIVLCSMQYTAEVNQTIDYFQQRGYFFYLHWLNPGFHDPFEIPMFDHLGLLPRLLAIDSVIGIRNGKLDPTARVEEIKQYIRGWAHERDLIIRE